MPISTLSLPIDIPWKRLAASLDMVATSTVRGFPQRWRSSLAVFSFDPAPDPEVADAESTTYLKVVATITGYQPEGEEIDGNALSKEWGTTLMENYQQLTNNSYPALSAIVQVAVFPVEGAWEVSSYPYLTDFEPKKREIVELVSETGETMTRSGTNINVRKGTTSTDSTEVIDIDRGGSLGASVTTPMGGLGAEATRQQEVGTRATLGTDTVNLTTTDSSREKRESFSHTTNLSQLYQLLDSYHAGTNRAVFLINARPHIVQSPYTFINGPRHLEGIQEFFLVVRRPRTMEKICVRATLETAHVHESTKTITEGETRYEQRDLKQTFFLHADGYSTWAEDTVGDWRMHLPSGFRLDRSRGGDPFSITWSTGRVDSGTMPAGVTWSIDSLITEDSHLSDAIPVVATFDDHVDIAAHIWGTQNFTNPRDADATYTVTVFGVSEEPVETPHTRTEHSVNLFITSREVSSCPLPTLALPETPYVAYEAEAPPSLVHALAASREPGPQAVLAANLVSRQLREVVISSFEGNRRYEPGAVNFLATRFAMRDLLSRVSPAQLREVTEPLADLVPDDIKGHIRKYAPKMSIGEVLAAGIENAALALGVHAPEIRTVAIRALGLGAAKPAGKTQQPRRGKAASLKTFEGSTSTKAKKTAKSTKPGSL